MMPTGDVALFCQVKVKVSQTLGGVGSTAKVCKKEACQFAVEKTRTEGAVEARNAQSRDSAAGCPGMSLRSRPRQRRSRSARPFPRPQNRCCPAGGR